MVITSHCRSVNGSPWTTQATKPTQQHGTGTVLHPVQWGDNRRWKGHRPQHMRSHSLGTHWNTPVPHMEEDTSTYELLQLCGSPLPQLCQYQPHTLKWDIGGSSDPTPSMRFQLQCGVHGDSWSTDSNTRVTLAVSH